jgi:mono/diheme cytochrome c family protein
MATYLKALPQRPVSPTLNESVQAAVQGKPAKVSRITAQGAHVYDTHCAQCHGEKGQGIAGAYPALAGNRSVTMPVATNPIQAILYGGFAPATVGNPRPFGMPPYVLVLSDADIAAVATYIRAAWGNQGAEVSELEVSRMRTGSGQ